MFSGGIISIFFTNFTNFSNNLRCSWGNLSENVYVKILLLTLIEKFSRMCDFCLIIADRPVGGFIFVGTNFRGLNKTDTFVGFKICGHSIFFKNSYRKLPIHWYWNLWIGPPRKPRKLVPPTKIKPSTVLGNLFILWDCDGPFKYSCRMKVPSENAVLYENGHSLAKTIHKNPKQICSGSWDIYKNSYFTMTLQNTWYFHDGVMMTNCLWRYRDALKLQLLSSATHCVSLLYLQGVQEQ